MFKFGFQLLALALGVECIATQSKKRKRGDISDGQQRDPGSYGAQLMEQHGLCAVDTYGRVQGRVTAQGFRCALDAFMQGARGDRSRIPPKRQGSIQNKQQLAQIFEAQNPPIKIESDWFLLDGSGHQLTRVRDARPEHYQRAAFVEAPGSILVNEGSGGSHRQYQGRGLGSGSVHVAIPHNKDQPAKYLESNINDLYALLQRQRSTPSSSGHAAAAAQ